MAKLILRNQVRVWSIALSKNELVEDYRRDKTQKPNAARFWVQIGVVSISLWSSFLVQCGVRRDCCGSNHLIHPLLLITGLRASAQVSRVLTDLPGSLTHTTTV